MVGGLIRRYDPADLSELLGVWHDAAQLAHPFWTRQRLERERRDISQEFLPASETWVYEIEGRVVGFIAMLGTEVGGLFVAPSSHRKGIGRALMDHVKASRDCLTLEVFEANHIGRTFYDAFGFEVVGERLEEATGFRVLLMEFHN